MTPFRNLILLFSIALYSALSSVLFAQEELYELRNAHAVQVARASQQPAEATASRSDNIERGRFIYMVDTLELPFFDDFTTDRIKKFDAKTTDQNVSLKINYDFKANGEAPIRLEYMHDTTKSTIKTLDGQIIEYNNPTLFITFFDEGKPVGADTGWTNVLEAFDESSGLVTYDTLIPDEVLVNFPDTFYRVEDDRSLWVPPTDTFDTNISAPFVNNSYPKNPITQGVATFDGTDRRGFPYDITTETTYGQADQLISKPIRLDSNMLNVYLSFFYQGGGNGNLPDEEDSLVVQFFDVRDSIWRAAWSTPGRTLEDTTFSEQVFIPIEGRPYLQDGFRFRFINYATLSGSLDHWHIDYVRVGEDRDTIRDDTINDVAFLSGIRTFLNDFTAVPYSHYLENPAFFETDRVQTKAINLGGEESFLQGLRYEVFDPSGTLAFGAVTSNPNIGAFTRQTTLYPIEDDALFPDLGTSSADFEVRCRFTASGLSNAQQINDTIRTTQEFRNYYAYDDGTAEKAYALTGAGLKLAYEFNTPIEDTIKAIYFNFPQTLHDENDELSIELMVWSSLESDPIYVSEQLVEPTYTDGNRFIRIKLEEPVAVQDRFFIGFRQIEATKIYIGFDVNTDASSFIHYEINGTWYESSFSGALLMRPHFSELDLLGAPEIAAKTKESPLRLFPNPAQTMVNILVPEEQINTVELIDLYGRVVLNQPFYGKNSLDLSGLFNGIYIVRVSTFHGGIHTQKLIVRH
jgi:hypothetical protein